MGFYGNVSNITRSTFQFDRIYGSRSEMEEALASGNDDVYIGRYTLVEYDQAIDFEVFTRIFPRVVKQEDAEDQIWFYTEKYKASISDKKLVSGIKGKYYYTGDDDASASSSQLKNIVLYKCEKEGAYILGEPTNTVEDDHIGFVKVTDISENDSAATNYTINYNLDKEYGNGRGYDGTVWMKTYVGDDIKYVMIAELNSVIPTFAISVDAPSEIPNQPHFGKDSTNVYYDLHVQPSWGFRIKEAKDENGEDLPSDVKIEQNYTYYNLEGNQELGKGVASVNGDIYFNADGFKIDKSTHDNSVKDTIKLSKGSSGAQVYNKHDGSINLESAEDIQELSIRLPSIGNAVANLYDVLYSNERNTMMDWRYHGYENGGLRLSQFFTEKDNETGEIIKEGYKYNPDQMGTLVASINTLHDFVGMVIDDKSYKSSNYIGTDVEALAQRKQQFINTSDENTIYYDEDTNKYFRKTIGYDYLDTVKYEYKLINIDADNYQSNIYYIKDGSDYVPDITGIYQADKEYYARSAVNDEYYDKVNLTNYVPGKYYSLINGIYTKSIAENFDEALNYYDISQRVAKTFDGAYVENQYYLKDTTNGVKYSLYGEKYNIDGENKDIIHNQLSSITKQDTKNVVFYRQGYWFYQDANGYYLDEQLTKDRIYYIIADAQKTTIRDAYNKPVDIYIPLPGTKKIEINPEKYYILDYDKPEEWEDKIFTIDNNKDYILTSAIETKKVPDSEQADEVLFHFIYGENNDLKEIKYVEFKDNLQLYTPNTYYSEDATKPIDFSLDSGLLDLENKNYYEFDPEVQAIPKHDNNINYFYTPYDESKGASKVGYYFEKDDSGNYNVLTGILPTNGEFYKLSNNDLYVIEDTNHIYDKYTVWNSNATIIPSTLTLKRRKEKYVFEELKEFGINYNTLLGILLEARRVLSTSLDIPEETRDTSTVQGCINKLNDIFAYFDNRYPGQFLITDAYDRIVNASITTAQSDIITNVGNNTESAVDATENRWIEVNINSDPNSPQIKYQHNFNRVENTDTSSNKNVPETGENTGLNNTTDDTLSLYTPIVDGMGHVVGKNIETVVLPYGYKTFTTNGAVDSENDFYSTINEVEGGANTTDITVSGVNQSIASNTQDIIAIEPFNKWIQTKIEDDKINIAHSIHSVDITKNTETDINDNGDTITLQDMVFDKAGHIIENHPHTYTLPYGFKKVKVVNSAGASNTEGLSITATTTVIADNTQDQFSIETGNRWIRMSAVNGADNKITIQHEIHKQDTHNGEAKIDLTTADTPKTFDIKSYSFDEAGHVDGTITTTVSMPTNYGIFTDGKTATTTAQGTQSTMTVKGDEIHLLPTIGTDTIMFTHIGPDTTTVNTTTTLASNTVGGKPFASFGDSFTIANVSYDKQGHINGTSTFDIKIPEIMPTTTNARDGSNADVITTITINSKTGEIDATRDSVSNLKLTGFTATATTSLTAEPIKNDDDVKTAFNKVESRLNGAENRLDTLQGEGEGSVAKAVADAISALSTLIETDYVKKTDYDALKQEVDALKALVEQYHPTSSNP